MHCGRGWRPWGSGDELKHKVLAVVEEQGAERVSYALKLLLSEGRLSNVSTIKNPQTGNLEAKENLVEGPTAVFYTTTSPEPDDELTNRVILLTVNESREQTRRIHQLQWERRTLQGMVASEKREALLKLHQDAQRMLRPLAVVNEARERRSCPDNRIWMRRDNEKYLCLVDSLAFLRQYQKEVRVLHRCGKQVEYVVVDDVDRELAEALASVVLEPSLDELLPQDRKLLEALRDLVGRVCADQGLDPDQVRFTRRQARQFIGWTEKQVRVHMDRLVEHEYVAVHRGRHGQGFVYELTYDAEPVGGTGTSTNFVHSESHFVPPSSMGVQAVSADGNGEKPTSSTDPENTYRAPDLENASQMKTDSP